MAIVARLFNAGVLPAEWAATAVTAGAVLSVQGPGAADALVLDLSATANAAIPWTGIESISQYDRVVAAIDAGDFDIAVVFQVLVWPHSQGYGFVNFPSMSGVYVATDTASLAKVWMGWYEYGNPGPVGGPFVVSFATDAAGGPTGTSRWIEFRPPIKAGDRIARMIFRVTRVGTTLTLRRCWATNDAGTPEQLMWMGNSLPDDTTFTDPCAGGAGILALVAGLGTKTAVRAVLPLTAGAYTVPAAPTNGLAASAPMPGDVDLGVAFAWDATPADTARTIEIDTALNSGFTTSPQRTLIDGLAYGQVPAWRRGGCTAGQRVYARARWRDELDQAGAWSAAVSAVAAVTPGATVTPNYTLPLRTARLPDTSIRAVRLRIR